MSKSRRRIFELFSEWGGFLKRQETPFKVNILKNLAARFATNLTAQYQPIYITELGANPLILGIISSISGIANTILSIPTGIIVDRVGIKNVFLMIISISTLSALIFGVAHTWEIAAIGLVLSTISLTLNGTACPMICGSTLSSNERVTGMGICDTVSFFPQLIAPIIGAYLITFFGGMNVEGIRPLYFLQIGGLIIAFFIVLTRFENPRHHPKIDREGERGLRFLSDLKSVISEGTMIKRWILITIFSRFQFGVMFYIPLFAAELKGADQFIIGGMSAASTIVLVFLAIPLGYLADTKGRKKIIFAATGLVGLSYLFLVWAPNYIFLLLSGFLSGFRMTAGQTQLAISADLVPKDYLGRWYGILGFFRGLMTVIAPIICGFMWDAVNPQSVFVLLMLTQLLGLGVLLTVPTSITK